MCLKKINAILIILLLGAGMTQSAFSQVMKPSKKPDRHTVHHLIGIKYDVLYGYGTCLDGNGQPYQKELLLDAYYPLNHQVSNKPALLLIHGGLWSPHHKDAKHLVDAANYFTSRGMVCFSIDYRDVPSDPDADGINKWQVAQRASYVDAKAAIRWIRAHATEYGIDPDAIAAYGGSSGAGTAIMLAISDPDDFATDYPGGEIPATNHPEQDPRIQACFEFWGTCFELEVGSPPVVRCFDFSDEFSPDDAPMQIFHGTEDPVIPFTHAQAIVQKCYDQGIYYDFVELEGYMHGVWDAVIGRVTLNEMARDFLYYNLGWNIFLNPL